MSVLNITKNGQWCEALTACIFIQETRDHSGLQSPNAPGASQVSNVYRHGSGSIDATLPIQPKWAKIMRSNPSASAMRYLLRGMIAVVFLSVIAQ